MTHRRHSNTTNGRQRLRILTEATGADLVEWALLVALIAIVALVAVAAFGDTLGGVFTTIADTVSEP